MVLKTRAVAMKIQNYYKENRIIAICIPEIVLLVRLWKTKKVHKA